MFVVDSLHTGCNGVWCVNQRALLFINQISLFLMFLDTVLSTLFCFCTRISFANKSKMPKIWMWMYHIYCVQRRIWQRSCIWNKQQHNERGWNKRHQRLVFFTIFDTIIALFISPWNSPLSSSGGGSPNSCVMGGTLDNPNNVLYLLPPTSREQNHQILCVLAPVLPCSTDWCRLQ